MSKEMIGELREIARLVDTDRALAIEIETVDIEREAEHTAFLKQVKNRLVAHQKKGEKSFKALAPKPSKILKTALPAVPQKPQVKNPFASIVAGVISEFLMFIGFALWLIMVITDSENYGLVFFSIFLMLGSIVFWLWKGRGMIGDIMEWLEQKERWTTGRKQWINAMEADYSTEAQEKFWDQWQAYDISFSAFVKDCNAVYMVALNELLEDERAGRERAFAKLEALKHESDKVAAELASKTVISPALYHLAKSIAGNLEIGRADTLKDAINLALDDERRDAEEAARRAEAARQAEIRAAQVEEARRHNEAQEQAAREAAYMERRHREEMERAARAQTAAAERQAAAAAQQARAAENAARDAKRRAEQQARDARREEHRAHNEAMHRCSSCVNSAKCSGHAKGNPSCAAYRPR